MLQFPISLQEICMGKIVRENLDYKILPKILKITIDILHKQRYWENMWNEIGSTHTVNYGVILNVEYKVKNTMLLPVYLLSPLLSSQYKSCNCYNCIYDKFFNTIKYFSDEHLKDFLKCDNCYVGYGFPCVDEDLLMRCDIQTLEKICLKIKNFPYNTHIDKYGCIYFVTTQRYKIICQIYLPINPETLYRYYPDLKKSRFLNQEICTKN